MANWTGISRNSRKHGHFAGQSEREQDAYFDFFAGQDQSPLAKTRIALQKILRYAKRQCSGRRLRWTQPRLAYQRPSDPTQVR